jgi:hypothetical protein
MNRYEPGTPRTAFGLLAAALTALTIGLLIVVPSRMDAGPSEAVALARARLAKPPTEVAISPARIEVIGVRDREVAVAKSDGLPPKAKPAS